MTLDREAKSIILDFGMENDPAALSLIAGAPTAEGQVQRARVLGQLRHIKGHNDALVRLARRRLPDTRRRYVQGARPKK